MAKPTTFLEQNDTMTLSDGSSYPVWVRETNLGAEKTVQVITAWQLTPEEIQSIEHNEGIVFLTIYGGQPPVAILGADPVPFEGQNVVYTHPECYDLPVHQTEVMLNGQPSIVVTSAWQLQAEQMNTTRANGGIVFLRVVGGQPVVHVTTINPLN